MHTYGVWRASVIACTLATGVDTFLDVQSPLRLILALCFLLLCPGMALVGLLRIDDMAVRVTLSLALSVAVDASVATIALYAHAWSSPLIFTVLAGITLGIVALEIAVHRRGAQRAHGLHPDSLTPWHNKAR
ncbi:MAG: hypothetical protein M3Y74_20035 [Chloroflexota bacterium]|nr:hypothetical protein [Chloroflexota bacterium]